MIFEDYNNNKKENLKKKPVYTTIKELKKINYKSKSIKDELSDNLSNLLKNGKPSFFGIFMAMKIQSFLILRKAILSKHNINFLGLRGQAKTRLARMMVNLLDEWIPVVDGSEINDDPLNPISLCKKIINNNGDDTKNKWMHKSERFYEKLATPDVTVSDLIGDIDPIKAASLSFHILMKE